MLRQVLDTLLRRCGQPPSQPRDIQIGITDEGRSAETFGDPPPPPPDQSDGATPSTPQ